MLLKILFGEVLEISLGEVNISLEGDFLVVIKNLDVLSEMTNSATDLDALSEELSKGLSIEDFILNGFGAVDGEVA